MKTSALAFAASLALAACGGLGGGGSKADLVKWCVDSGDAPADCECMAGRLQAELSPELFSTLATGFAAGEDAAAEALENLPEDQQMEAMSALIEAGMSCTGTVPDEG